VKLTCPLIKGGKSLIRLWIFHFIYYYKIYIDLTKKLRKTDRSFTQGITIFNNIISDILFLLCFSQGSKFYLVYSMMLDDEKFFFFIFFSLILSKLLLGEISMQTFLFPPIKNEIEKDILLRN